MSPLDQIQATYRQAIAVHDVILHGRPFDLWMRYGLATSEGMRLELYTDGAMIDRVALLVPLTGYQWLPDAASVQCAAIIRHLCKA